MLLFSIGARSPRASWSTADAIVRTAEGDEPLVPLSSVAARRHLLADVLAAAGGRAIAGVDAAAMTRAVEGFTGLEHALEPVATIGGVRFVNDSKATNIEAARARDRELRPGLVVILGGRFKGGDFGDCASRSRAARRVRRAIGEARAADPRGARRRRSSARRRDDGRRRCGRRSRWRRRADGRLLAPACASFDMFRDYAERGACSSRRCARLPSGTRRDLCARAVERVREQ